jgi:hypothetical protein
MVLVAINNEDLEEVDYPGIMARLRRAARPFQLHFCPPLYGTTPRRMLLAAQATAGGKRQDALNMGLGTASTGGVFYIIETGKFLSLINLVKSGTNLAQVDGQGCTALHHAAKFGRDDMVKFLIAKGLALDRLCERKRAPVHYAAQAGSPKVVQLLVDAGADLALIDATGASPLHLAAAAGKLEALKCIISYGISWTATLSKGKIALHTAAFHGHTEIVEYLVELGADLHTADAQGGTALHYAAVGGHIACCEWLVSNGASTTATDSQMRTPLDAVVQSSGSSASSKNSNAAVTEFFRDLGRPPAAPASPSLAAPFKTSLLIVWAKAAVAVDDCTAFEVQLRRKNRSGIQLGNSMGTSMGTAWTPVCTMIDGSARAHTIYGLQAGTTYFCRIRCCNKEGWSAFSKESAPMATLSPRDMSSSAQQEGTASQQLEHVGDPVGVLEVQVLEARHLDITELRLAPPVLPPPPPTVLALSPEEPGEGIDGGAESAASDTGDSAVAAPAVALPSPPSPLVGPTAEQFAHGYCFYAVVQITGKGTVMIDGQPQTLKQRQRTRPSTPTPGTMTRLLTFPKAWARFVESRAQQGVTPDPSMRIRFEIWPEDEKLSIELYCCKRGNNGHSVGRCEMTIKELLQRREAPGARFSPSNSPSSSAFALRLGPHSASPASSTSSPATSPSPSRALRRRSSETTLANQAAAGAFVASSPSALLKPPRPLRRASSSPIENTEVTDPSFRSPPSVAALVSSPLALPRDRPRSNTTGTSTPDSSASNTSIAHGFSSGRLGAAAVATDYWLPLGRSSLGGKSRGSSESFEAGVAEETDTSGGEVRLSTFLTQSGENGLAAHGSGVICGSSAEWFACDSAADEKRAQRQAQQKQGASMHTLDEYGYRVPQRQQREWRCWLAYLECKGEVKGEHGGMVTATQWAELGATSPLKKPKKQQRQSVLASAVVVGAGQLVGEEDDTDEAEASASEESQKLEQLEGVLGELATDPGLWAWDGLVRSVRRLAWNGIPPALRAAVYTGITGAAAQVHKHSDSAGRSRSGAGGGAGLYACMSARAEALMSVGISSTGREPMLTDAVGLASGDLKDPTLVKAVQSLAKQIDSDIGRAFDSLHTVINDGEGRAMLRRLLVAHLLYQADHEEADAENTLHRSGYCESLMAIAARLLSLMDEEHTFWMLDAICRRVCPGLYSRTASSSSSSPLTMHLAVIDSLIAYRLPRLSVHMKEANFSTAFVAGPWVLSLFSSCCSSEPFFRILDVLTTHAIAEPTIDSTSAALLPPTTAIMYAVTLALFEAAAPSILKACDHRGINRVFRRADFVTLDADVMMLHVQTQYHAILPIVARLQAKVFAPSPSAALDAGITPAGSTSSSSISSSNVAAEKAQQQAQAVRSLLTSNRQSALECSFTAVREALRVVMRRHAAGLKQKTAGASANAAGRAIFTQAMFTICPQLAGVEEQATAARVNGAEEKRVMALIRMGFPRAWCTHALAVNDANVQLASNWIRSHKEALEDVDRRNDTQHPSPESAGAQATPEADALDEEQVQIVLLNETLAAFELSDGTFDLRCFVICFAALHHAASITEKLWLCALACHFTSSTGASESAQSALGQQTTARKEGTPNAPSAPSAPGSAGGSGTRRGGPRASFSLGSISKSAFFPSKSMSSVSGSLMSFARSQGVTPPRIGQQQTPPKSGETVLRLEAKSMVTLLVTLYGLFCKRVNPVAVGHQLQCICIDLFGSFGAVNFKELVHVVHVQPLLAEYLRLQGAVTTGETGERQEQPSEMVSREPSITLSPSITDRSSLTQFIESDDDRSVIDEDEDADAEEGFFT